MMVRVRSCIVGQTKPTGRPHGSSVEGNTEITSGSAPISGSVLAAGQCDESRAGRPCYGGGEGRERVRCSGMG
jgi:hypothetical protein